MSDSATDRQQAVFKIFLFPENMEEMAAQLTSRFDDLPSSRKLIVQALVESLRGVTRTLSIPFQYTYSQVRSLHWQRISMAERIRSLKSDDEHTRDDVARKAAEQKFAEFLDSKEEGQKIAREVLDHLALLAEHKDSLAAARELTRQGVVLTWSAFEVFCRDLFVDLLNDKPELAERLLASPAGRKRFTVEKIDWQTLTSFGFDLSSSLGTFLSRRTDLDDIQTIRDAFGALFPNANSLNQRLADADLWLLFQKRNLIVHRRGIVDKQYLEKTGDKLAIGDSMWISPDEIERLLQAVVAACNQMVSETVAIE